MLMKPLLAILVSVLSISGSAVARTTSPEGTQVYIISPTDGETVTSPITVKLGLKGMEVAPAGIDKAKTRHHHLLIDLQGTTAHDKPLPADAQHNHFGSGQSEATIELATGKPSLQLLMGDHNHIPHNPPVMSEIITITV